ncbi:molybdopterin-dependent oxidoreductase [Chloroflexota bacterium]
MSESVEMIQTVCGFCHAKCGMVIETQNGVIQKINGNQRHPANRGILCPKGLAAKELVYSPGRLQYPLKKTNVGFERISWDEALDTIASRLIDIKGKHGANTLVLCCGAPITEETAYGYTQLVAAYGSSNFTGPAHLCSVPRNLALQLVHGDRSQPDYEHTRLMLMWGANPTDSRQLAENSPAYGGFDQIIYKARKRGAKLLVIDPKRTDIAAQADEWIQINIGTDLALGLSMLNVIISEALFDKEFVDNWTIGFNELSIHVRHYTPLWAEGITGVKASKIVDVARMYATTKPALIHDGNGLDQHTNVVQTVRVLGILSAITGNVDIPGGDVFFPRTHLGRYLTVRPETKRLGADKYPLFPSVPFPVVVDSLLNREPDMPRAMIVHHSNPLLINANEKRVRDALSKLEFLVVSDLFPTATAQLADVILPDTSDFERFGYEGYSSPMGGFLALRHKVVEPIGESRPAFDVEYELAKRMELGNYYHWKTTEEWINYRLQRLGITLEDLKQKSIIYTTPPKEYRKHLKDGFNTPSRKVELYSQRLKDNGYDPLPIYSQPLTRLNSGLDPVDKYPLVGTTRRPGIYVHTKFRNLPKLQKIQPAPLAWIHEDDARVRGISDGDNSIVSSSEGIIEVKVRITTDIQSGVVVVDFGWGNPWDDGVNVNILTSDDVRDPVCAATSNRRFLCQIEKV